ncbi:MAG: LacI family DNA-binding transcriptional regulator [Dysosmobacter welbionis]
MKNVTLKDVARAAGVSYSTVSRSLSGSPQIGRETRSGSCACATRWATPKLCGPLHGHAEDGADRSGSAFY